MAHYMVAGGCCALRFALLLLAAVAAEPSLTGSGETPAYLSLAFEHAPALHRYGGGTPQRRMFAGGSDRLRVRAFSAADEAVALAAGARVEWTVESDGSSHAVLALEPADGDAAIDATGGLLRGFVHALCDSDAGGPTQCGSGGGGSAAGLQQFPALLPPPTPPRNVSTSPSFIVSGGATATLRALQPGRATVCALLLAADGGSPGGLAACCAHVRVLHRLATAPTGVLRMPPAAHVRMRLFRLQAGGDARSVGEEVALPTHRFLWLAANPRVICVAMHHGRLDSVALGATKLIVVDMGSREAELAADVQHAARCGGETWAVPGADECHGELDDDAVSGGLVRAVVVEEPAAAVMWLEPAAWPPFLLAPHSAGAAADVEEEEEEAAEAEAVAAAQGAAPTPRPPLLLHEALPDDDCGGGPVAPRCVSPFVRGAAGAALPPPALISAPVAAEGGSARTACARPPIGGAAVAAWMALQPFLAGGSGVGTPLAEQLLASAALAADGSVSAAAADSEAPLTFALECTSFGPGGACHSGRAEARAPRATLVLGRRYELRLQLASADGSRMLAGSNVRFTLRAACSEASATVGGDDRGAGSGAAGMMRLLVQPGPPPPPRRRGSPPPVPMVPQTIECGSGSSAMGAAGGGSGGMASDRNSSSDGAGPPHARGASWDAATAASLTVLPPQQQQASEARLSHTAPCGGDGDDEDSAGADADIAHALPPMLCLQLVAHRGQLQPTVARRSGRHAAPAAVFELHAQLNDVQHPMSNVRWRTGGAPHLASRLALAVVAPLRLRFPHSRRSARRGHGGGARVITVAVPAGPAAARTTFPLVVAAGAAQPPLAFAVVAPAATAAPFAVSESGEVAFLAPSVRADSELQLRWQQSALLWCLHADVPENALALRLVARRPAELELRVLPVRPPGGETVIGVFARDADGALFDYCAAISAELAWHTLPLAAADRRLLFASNASGADASADALRAAARVAGGVPPRACGVAVVAPGPALLVTVALRGSLAVPAASVRVPAAA